jgi:hypothetical protein
MPIYATIQNDFDLDSMSMVSYLLASLGRKTGHVKTMPLSLHLSFYTGRHLLHFRVKFINRCNETEHNIKK